MPARKPSALIKRHETGAERTQRALSEASLRPARSLPQSAPARLAGHEAAETAWRRMMRVYGAIDGEIVTAMDMDLLVDYCLLMEQIAEMDGMRKLAHQALEFLQKRWDTALKNKDSETMEAVAKILAASFDAVVKVDARADRKRALLLQMRQSLYMTPRARAGAAPRRKEEESPADAFEQMLNEFNQEMLGGQS